MTIKLGAHNLNDEEDLANTQSFKVVNVKQHPMFKRNGFYNDICLLKLDRNVLYDDFVSPICLPDEQLRTRNLASYMTTVTDIGGGGGVWSDRLVH